jgi:hypothetical protein
MAARSAEHASRGGWSGPPAVAALFTVAVISATPFRATSALTARTA